MAEGFDMLGVVTGGIRVDAGTVEVLGPDLARTPTHHRYRRLEDVLTPEVRDFLRSATPPADPVPHPADGGIYRRPALTHPGPNPLPTKEICPWSRIRRSFTSIGRSIRNALTGWWSGPRSGVDAR